MTELIKTIEKLKTELDTLRPFDNKKIIEALEIEYTYESNRIEGNTLTLRETDLVINKGLTISGKSLDEHLEAINHRDAIEYIRELATNKIAISEKVIKDIHNLILRGINRENAGKYRSVPVMISGSKHLPPQPYIVPKQMEDFIIWYNENKENLHPVLMASELHLRLVSIHPFIDGNGRTSRLLMNLYLIQNGYPILITKGDTDSRLRYYEVLEQSQVNSKPNSFQEFTLNEMAESLENYLKIVRD